MRRADPVSGDATASAEPRLAPFPAEMWGEEVLAALREGRDSLLSDQLRDALDAADLPGLAKVLPNAITTMLHHPRLAGRFLAFNGVLLSQAALPARWRELLVLRVAWRTGSGYEWLQHVRMSPRYGITDEDLEAISEGVDGGRWAAPEADLLAAADQLLDRYCIEQATWERLARHLDERQLVELPFVVGTYAAQAMAYRSFRMQLDPGLRTVKAPAMPRVEE